MHGNGTPYSACEVFWFFARATNEPTFCLTTGTVFIFLTMPSADENHDVQIISKRLKLGPSESSKSEQAGMSLTDETFENQLFANLNRHVLQVRSNKLKL